MIEKENNEIMIGIIFIEIDDIIKNAFGINWNNLDVTISFNRVVTTNDTLTTKEGETLFKEWCKKNNLIEPTYTNYDMIEKGLMIFVSSKYLAILKILTLDDIERYINNRNINNPTYYNC